MTRPRTYFGQRVIALGIDSLVLFMLPFLIIYLGLFPNMHLFYTANMLLVLIPAVYFIVLHSKTGQTIGKLMMDIKVVDYSTEKNITYKQSLIRQLPNIVIQSGVLVYVFIAEFFQNELFDLNAMHQTASFTVGGSWTAIEIIYMFATPKKLAIHDAIAGSKVIYYLHPRSKK